MGSALRQLRSLDWYGSRQIAAFFELTSTEALLLAYTLAIAELIAVASLFTSLFASFLVIPTSFILEI